MQKTTTDPTRESILVIQSDPSEQKMLTTAFSAKYGLFFTNGVDQALQTNGRNVPYKVVIFDAGSAHPHDLLELERFKSGDRLETPIILLASNNSVEIEMKVAEIGVFYYLIKPYSVKDLEELIEAALRYWKKTFGWTLSGDKT
jgi:DNA-binding NtrC family response regulator